MGPKRKARRSNELQLSRRALKSKIAKLHETILYGGIKANGSVVVKAFFEKNTRPAGAGRAGELLPPEQSDNEELGQTLNAPWVHCQ